MEGAERTYKEEKQHLAPILCTVFEVFATPPYEFDIAVFDLSISERVFPVDRAALSGFYTGSGGVSSTSG